MDVARLVGSHGIAESPILLAPTGVEALAAVDGIWASLNILTSFHGILEM